MQVAELPPPQPQKVQVKSGTKGALLAVSIAAVIVGVSNPLPFHSSAALVPRISPFLRSCGETEENKTLHQIYVSLIGESRFGGRLHSLETFKNGSF